VGRRRLLWQLYPSYLIITGIALAAVTWYISGALRNFHSEQTALDLKARARLIENQVMDRLWPNETPSVDALVKKLGADSATRITVVRPDGTVLGDSQEDPARMENHADRPEIMAALQGEVGKSIRYSHTVQQEMMYVAVPMTVKEGIAAVVRTAIPVTAMDRTMNEIYGHLARGGLLIAFAAAVLSLIVSRRISRPLEEMERGARRFARGELGRRLPITGSEEIAALADALNQMAAQLDERLRLVVRERNEREAMLGSMVEGVLAVDTAERIIRLNRAAARLIGVPAGEVQGRSIQEVVRKVDLQRFVRQILQEEGPVEGDLVMRGNEGERFLQAHGTRLRGDQGQQIGALIVLNDVTRLRRLENLRSEFVANVSHELKTPVTAIKGAAETLLAGALEDPKGAERFIGIVAKQADRLGAIIDDLLALSRIEQEAGLEGVALEEGSLRPVLEGAIQTCAMAAGEKDIRINLFCDPELRAGINAPLLEQAVVNLLTNAVKYSDKGGIIVVDASLHAERVMIKVQDFGCGIDPQHLPRLFERFYRVDRARSRALGGTGLGLSIVKHIVQSHGGEVVVNSTPGKGSVFTIILPVP
jgi:two-component system phosphate regulon sensor histidine kinase PhoR